MPDSYHTSIARFAILGEAQTLSRFVALRSLSDGRSPICCRRSLQQPPRKPSFCSPSSPPPWLLEKMIVRFDEASQPTTDDEQPHIPTIEVIDNMYLVVVGGVKKKRLYGIGSLAYVTFPDAMSGHACRSARTSSSSAIANAITGTAAAAAAATADAAAVSARCEALTKGNEALRQEIDVLRQQVRHLTRNVLVQPPSSPFLIDDHRTLPPSL